MGFSLPRIFRAVAGHLHWPTIVVRLQGRFDVRRHQVFVWIDAVRHDTENRDEYIDRLTGVISNDWTALTPEQCERGVTHVRTSGYPETKWWILGHVEAARFRPGETLLEDEYFDGWVILKP